MEIDGEPAAIFDPNAPVDEQHIDAAKARVCGSGQWCGDYVAAPKGLYPFDQAQLSSEDQVVVAVLAMTVPRPTELSDAVHDPARISVAAAEVSPRAARLNSPTSQRLRVPWTCVRCGN